ncbi:WASH complex subunit 2 [Eupeodes corollae]|uniref:WASH complex subunit 2 n=1 Tax=Eupeodes corollae TaxID=290404 RepID=UPI00248F641E|nr:WASH complex subunit 2 [Eupeodes corollae]
MENQINADKIIEKSKQWTLEGDCSLLQWMNQISNNLEERVTKTSSALNEMSTKLDRTSIALSNATNKLAALQYSKFVENRVHEDDETLANQTNAPCEEVTDKKDMSQDIYPFLKKNVEMMNTCHEALSISYEDSDDDDEEPVTSVVYRSKNPYEARPLPHIYGSTMWKEKWHIGLCDSDNDFSGEENSEQFSESSSTADDSYESNALTISEWDSTAWGLNTQHHSSERKDLRTPSNDGESSYQGEDYSQSKVSTPRTQRHAPIAQQPIQDHRYYVHVPRRQEKLFDDIFDESKPQEEASSQVVPPPQVIPPQVVSAPQKKIIPESYIPNEPPPDEQSTESDSNRRVGAKKTLNLFDDDEFSSFMDQIVEKAANKNVKPNEQRNVENPEPPPKKSVVPNLFDDHIPPPDDDDDSQKLKQPKKTLAPNLFDDSNSPKQKEPSRAVAPNLFNDSDDLFSSLPKRTQEPPKKIIAPNLFNDSDDLFPPTVRKEQPIVQKKLESPAKSEDDDDIFKATPQAVSVIGKTKIKNLFDDDDEDDDFDNIFASKPSTSKPFTQATKNLFSDDLDVQRVSVVPPVQDKSVPKSSKDLFNNNSPLDIENATNDPLPKESPVVQKSLFNERSSVAEKPAIDPVLKKETPKGSSLLKKGLFDDFDDLEDEDDIFSNKPAKKDPFENLFQKEKLEKKLPIIQSKTLFGDDDEDENQEEDSKVLESKSSKEETKSEKSKPSYLEDIPPKDDTPTAGRTTEKTQVKDIFADEDPEDFEDFISTTPLKSEKLVVEDYSKTTSQPTEGIPPPNDIPSPRKSTEKTQLKDIFADEDPEDFISTTPSKPDKVVSEDYLNISDQPAMKPIETPSTKVPDEPTSISVATPRPPVIAQKPVVDKASKPQVKAFSKNIATEDLSKEIKDTTSALNAQIAPEKTKEVPTPSSEASLPILKPLDDVPKISEAAKSEIDGASWSSSKKNSTLDVKVSESSKHLVSKTQQTKVKDEENTQTKIVPKADGERSKPVPKPKPIVVIEEQKDIETPPEVPSSAKKSSIIPSYTSLFHDDIPPEDENPNPTSNEESPLHQVEEDVEVKPLPSASSSSVPYNSLNLFADVPPDDDFTESTPPTPPAASAVVTPTKRIHSIFYDDFNETIEAGREMRTPPSYMINDEPPPDDNKDSKPVTSEIKKEKPQVSKLKKMNIQINVGALLPSAKLPSFKKPEPVEKKPQIEITQNEQNTPSARDDPAPISKPAAPETTRELPENILPNLNKNRAKVQVKRRPSTRMGRKESYRKSMIEETITQEENEVDSFEIRTQEEISKKDFSVDNKNSKEQTPPKDLGAFDEKGETTEESKGSLNKLPDEATLFEESDNFFSKSVTSSGASSKATTTKLPSLFKNSDTEPDSIFATIKSNTEKSKIDSSPSLSSKNLDSLFDSDGIDENPFGTPKNFVTPSKTSQESNKAPQETKSKLDLLFDSVQPKEQTPKFAFKTTSKSLFGDSDDGSDDDLFKGARVTKKPVSHKKPEQKPSSTKQTKPSASLFSSDEGSGSGDDIFGKVKPKTVTKKNEIAKDKTAAAAATSSSLFADLSDDDSDSLFGTSTKVNKSKTNPTKSRTQSTKQPISAQPAAAKTISSNPLSDLLGP